MPYDTFIHFFFAKNEYISPPFQLLADRRAPVSKAPLYNKKEGKKNIFFHSKICTCARNCKATYATEVGMVTERSSHLLAFVYAQGPFSKKYISAMDLILYI